MNNLQQPAFPLPLVQNAEGEVKDSSDWDGPVGFTKLEYAAILIAQGMCANGIFSAEEAVLRAHLVLEQCSK